MKKMNKKGFTIVELVIVIAVIAILAAVMIPTFSGIVEKANESALEQKIAAAYKEAMTEELADDGLYNDSAYEIKKDADGDPIVVDGVVQKETYIEVNGIKFTWTADGQGKKNGNATVAFAEDNGYTSANITDGKVILPTT